MEGHKPQYMFKTNYGYVYGFQYIQEKKEFPNWIKIGKTIDLRTRMQAWEKDGGDKVAVVFAIKCHDCDDMERIVHKKLSDKKVDRKTFSHTDKKFKQRREWFDLKGLKAHEIASLVYSFIIDYQLHVSSDLPLILSEEEILRERGMWEIELYSRREIQNNEDEQQAVQPSKCKKQNSTIEINNEERGIEGSSHDETNCLSGAAKFEKFSKTKTCLNTNWKTIIKENTESEDYTDKSLKEGFEKVEIAQSTQIEDEKGKEMKGKHEQQKANVQPRQEKTEEICKKMLLENVKEESQVKEPTNPKNNEEKHREIKDKNEKITEKIRDDIKDPKCDEKPKNEENKRSSTFKAIEKNMVQIDTRDVISKLKNSVFYSFGINVDVPDDVLLIDLMIKLLEFGCSKTKIHHAIKTNPNGKSFSE